VYYAYRQTQFKMAPLPLALRTPQTGLEVIESWTDLPSDVRKRRAAEASQKDDRPVLRSLLVANIGLHGRRGTDTSPRTLDTYWRGAQHFLDWCRRSGAKPHQVEESEARRFGSVRSRVQIPAPRLGTSRRRPKRSREDGGTA